MSPALVVIPATTKSVIPASSRTSPALTTLRSGRMGTTSPSHVNLVVLDAGTCLKMPPAGSSDDPASAKAARETGIPPFDAITRRLTVKPIAIINVAVRIGITVFPLELNMIQAATRAYETMTSVNRRRKSATRNGKNRSSWSPNANQRMGSSRNRRLLSRDSRPLHTYPITTPQVRAIKNRITGRRIRASTQTLGASRASVALQWHVCGRA